MPIKGRAFWSTGEGLPYMEAIEKGELSPLEVQQVTEAPSLDTVQQAYRGYLRRKGITAYRINWATKPPIILGGLPSARPAQRGTLEALVQAAIEFAGETVRGRIDAQDRELRDLREENERLKKQVREFETEAETRMKRIAADAMKRAGLVGGD